MTVVATARRLGVAVDAGPVETLSRQREHRSSAYRRPWKARRGPSPSLQSGHEIHLAVGRDWLEKPERADRAVHRHGEVRREHAAGRKPLKRTGALAFEIAQHLTDRASSHLDLAASAA